MKYKKKLISPKWQKKRLQILQRDNFSCRSCFDIDSTLHVHHVRYLMHHEPWEYDSNDLLTLCDECHKEWHRIFDNNKSGKTFLVAKLHFDLDIKGMQNDIKRRG